MLHLFLISSFIELLLECNNKTKKTKLHTSGSHGGRVMLMLRIFRAVGDPLRVTRHIVVVLSRVLGRRLRLHAQLLRGDSCHLLLAAAPSLVIIMIVRVSVVLEEGQQVTDAVVVLRSAVARHEHVHTFVVVVVVSVGTVIILLVTDGVAALKALENLSERHILWVRVLEDALLGKRLLETVHLIVYRSRYASHA